MKPKITTFSIIVVDAFNHLFEDTIESVGEVDQISKTLYFFIFKKY